MDVNETMVRCVESFTPQALVHDMEIVQDFQMDLPCIRGNRDHLEQVFTNIIINSRDATRGRGRLTISTQFDSRKQIVVIKFADTGCGISSDHIDEIFDPFFTTKPPGKGTGLGLSIVHEIIRQHGGSIAVESHSPGGTTFTILLPLECPEDPSEDLENREGIP
jgi:two-component system NtrC family sensor kinase